MTNSGRKDIERLANLLLTLAGTRRGYTAAQLMEMVGYGGEPASRERALERDKQALNECGVNIEKLVDVLDENLVRYRVSPRPGSLRPNADEWPLLRAAADTLGRGALASRVRAKLAALGPRESSERYRVADENQPPDVALLLAAAAQAQTVEFSYRRPGSGGAKTRLVEPWQVAPVEGRWYLLGYDRQAGQKRLFRLSRIVSSPKLKGDAREERPTGQDIAQALEAYRAGKGGERRAVEFLAAPGKLLHERELAGAGPAQERFSLTLSYADALAVALANPLWCDLVAPADWAAKAGESYARIAALHRGEGEVPAYEEVAAAPLRRIRPGGGENVTLMASLAAYVYANPRVEVAHLAERFQLSREQVEKHLATLYMCGQRTPDGFEDLVEASWEDGVAQVANVGAFSQVLAFTEVEARALGEALGYLLPNLLPADQQLALGLMALLGTGAVHESGQETFSAGRETSAAEENPFAPLINEAISRGEDLTLLFAGAAQANPRLRTVTPLQLVISRGRLYLRAYCHENRAERRFRLDRIIACAKCADELQELLLACDGSRWEEEARAVAQLNLDQVTLRLAPGAWWLAEAFAGRLAGVTAEGDSIAVVTNPVPAALIEACFEADGEAEAVSPPQLRAVIRDIANARFSALSD
ncbi:helix-turn-helix transcriptional regulator [Dermabacteraceae bacterium P13101]